MNLQKKFDVIQLNCICNEIATFTPNNRLSYPVTQLKCPSKFKTMVFKLAQAAF